MSWLPCTPNRLCLTLTRVWPSLPYWPATVGIRDGRKVSSQSGFTRLKSCMKSAWAKP